MTKRAETCKHTVFKPGYWVEVEHPYTGEVTQEWQQSQEEPTHEDMDWGRYRCTQCGHVMYYTGLWRDYWEKGIPCSSSSLVPKHLRPANLKVELELPDRY